jgi:methyl-accepting chemotaxis protein
MEKRAPIEVDTQVNPNGKAMDAAVKVLPITGERGEIAGFCEILTDITALKNNQRAVAEVTGQATIISDRIAAASEELSAQVEQVSRGADTQRERMESTASAMNEMNSTVMEVARSAGQASEHSEGTKDKATHGAEVVGKVVESMGAVNAVTTALQTSMYELGAQVENISQVMNIISDIADQTNLLALNAAIEAARAGEAGRGFAVVADEVRKLAEKTVNATKDVGDSVTAIMQATQQNIANVEAAARNIHEATEHANTSGVALKEIVEFSSTTSAIVASIATAAEEQSATSEEINGSITEVSRIVSETADGMVQSSSAVQDLAQMAQELRAVMEKLK